MWAISPCAGLKTIPLRMRAPRRGLRDETDTPSCSATAKCAGKIQVEQVDAAIEEVVQ